MAGRDITAELLRERLSYNQDTGEFRWRVTLNPKTRTGDIAGYPVEFGYIYIGLHYKKYPAHRLAWLFCYGRLPRGEIDHIDGNTSNNAITNLREATRSINTQNIRAPRSHNKSTGFLGVAPVPHSYRYRASIRVDGKQIHLGCFDTREAAHAAYLTAKRRLHPGCTI